MRAEPFKATFSSTKDLYVHSSSISGGYFTRDGYVETIRHNETFDPPRFIPATRPKSWLSRLSDWLRGRG